MKNRKAFWRCFLLILRVLGLSVFCKLQGRYGMKFKFWFIGLFHSEKKVSSCHNYYITFKKYFQWIILKNGAYFSIFLCFWWEWDYVSRQLSYAFGWLNFNVECGKSQVVSKKLILCSNFCGRKCRTFQILIYRGGAGDACLRRHTFLQKSVAKNLQ